MGRPPRAIILDLGNVLLFHDNALLFRRLAERAGRSSETFGPELIHHPLWTQANRGELNAEALRRAVCTLMNMDVAEDEFRSLWSCHFTLNEPVLAWVEALVGRVRLALLSNTNLLHAEYFLPKLPLLKRFDALLLSHETGRIKPEPEAYLGALRALSCPPEDAAFFDDIPEYVAAAKALGMRAFVFKDVASFRADIRALGLEV